MNNVIRTAALLLIMLAGCSAEAATTTKTWVVIGDSIMSAAFGGTANEHALHLVSSERDVIFRNLASPGASLGARDFTGFNSQGVIDSINRISGVFNNYQGIVIQAGTNDYGRSLPLADVQQSVRRLLSHARKAKKKVLVLEPIWRADEAKKNKRGLTLNHYRYAIGYVCANEFKDVCRFAFRANTILGTSAGADLYETQEVAKGKQLHPDAAGHRKMADWIEAEAAKAGFF